MAIAAKSGNRQDYSVTPESRLQRTSACREFDLCFPTSELQQLQENIHTRWSLLVHMIRKC
jgi:hypothetical protein